LGQVGQPADHYFFTFPLVLLSTSTFDLPDGILKLEHQNSKFWWRPATPLAGRPPFGSPIKELAVGASSSYPLSIYASETLPLFHPGSENFLV
jgi:hypothetical protein